MKYLYLCAIASFMLFTTSCSKDEKPSPQVDPPVDKTSVSFTYDTIGTTELYYLISQNIPAVKINFGKPARSFSYEITGSNGLKHSSDTLVKGTGALDGNGNASLNLYGFGNYRDGEITLKVKFADADTIVQVKTQKAEYRIRHYRDFIHMAPFRSPDTADHYIQVRDFAFPDTVFTTAPFTMYLTGSYDGQGHKISNLTINSPGSDGNSTPRLGLFTGADSGSTLKNIRLELSDNGITSSGAANAGGLIGFAWMTNVINCSVKGNILINKQASSYSGGISGFNHGVKMTGCSFRGRITGSNIGGLMGSLGSSTIDMCYAYFSFDTYAAGGIGSVYSPDVVVRISNSYVVAYNYTAPTFVAIGPVQFGMSNTIVTNCFANAGTAQDGVTIFPLTVDINTHLSTLTIADWPVGVPAPADKKPFKYDEDMTSPMKLWWE